MRTFLTTAVLAIAWSAALAADDKTQILLDCQTKATALTRVMTETIQSLDRLSAQLDENEKIMTRAVASSTAVAIAVEAESKYDSVGMDSLTLRTLLENPACAGAFAASAAQLPRAYSSRALAVAMKIYGQKTTLAEADQNLRAHIERRDDRARAWRERYGRTDELLNRRD